MERLPEREFQYELIRLELESKHNFELIKQTNQSTIDFALRALQSIFLINGAAATAILASKAIGLYFIAIKFALGAGSVVFIFGLSYLFSILNVEYMMHRMNNPEDDTLPIIVWNKIYYLNKIWIFRLRNLIIITFVGILIFFVYTLASAWQTIEVLHMSSIIV